MQRFSELYQRLDATTSTNAKVAAMTAYFRRAPAADAAWAFYFLSGRRFKRLLAPGKLRPWATEAAGLEPWLFEASYAAVGDLAETVALLVGDDDAPPSALPLHRWVEERIEPLRHAAEDEQRGALLSWWRRLPSHQVFVLAKLLTGALRVGVSRTLAVRAVAAAAGLDPAVVAHRVMGRWRPSADFFEGLLAPEQEGEDQARPYPFFLAAPLEADPAAALGPREGWQVEWKWDGIRAQLVRRGGETYLWSRGEELITERFPEIAEAAVALPDGTVLDGEVLAWRGDAPLPFALLQKRIGRKRLGKKILAEAPAAFLAYDLLEHDGEDRRTAALAERRRLLEDLLERHGGLFRLSPVVDAESWAALAALRETARSRGVEGFMLKRLSSPYRTGRTRGDWWKWKVDPFTVDAVMIYAQAGHGRRANLFTDYTFAVWNGDGELVPFAKAYSGLTDAEIRRLDRWIRRHTRERFGPVRAVEPEQVFELAFEDIRPSRRHKSGVAVRFPRIRRWREDKPPAEADTLATVEGLIVETEAVPE